jgi:hypothetical protein
MAEYCMYYGDYRACPNERIYCAGCPNNEQFDEDEGEEDG